jgi:hypothetical protein
LVERGSSGLFLLLAGGEFLLGEEAVLVLV